MYTVHENPAAKLGPTLDPESLPPYLRPAKLQTDREIRVKPGTSQNRQAWSDYVAQSADDHS